MIHSKMTYLILTMVFGSAAIAGNVDVGSAGQPSPMSAHVVCQNSNSSAITTIELLPSSSKGKFQIKTSQVQNSNTGVVSNSGSSQRVSQPMNCQISAAKGLFKSAVCNLAILNIKFEPNSDGQFTISQAMSLPDQPDFKDPAAMNYGNDFSCQILK
jgi:hypothetical protein